VKNSSKFREIKPIFVENFDFREIPKATFVNTLIGTPGSVRNLATAKTPAIAGMPATARMKTTAEKPRTPGMPAKAGKPGTVRTSGTKGTPAAAEMLATAGTQSIEGMQSNSNDASSDARKNSLVFTEICKKLVGTAKICEKEQQLPFLSNRLQPVQ
jgi:hypothetical protein